MVIIRCLLTPARRRPCSALAASLLAMSCGGGGSTPAPSPATPATTPTPTPAPDPSGSGVTGLEFASRPMEARLGYQAGGVISGYLYFSRAVEVSGSPRLRIDIGENARRAALEPASSGSGTLAFRYEVLPDDHDADGISIPADAIDLDSGTIAFADGTSLDPDLGEHAVVNDPLHQVLIGIGVAAVDAGAEPAQFQTGHVAGDILGLRVGFTGRVEVTGAPKLRLEIGDDERFARFDRQRSETTIVFLYRVGDSDHDSDGISVPADALDLSGGSIVSYHREETPVFTDLGRHAIENAPGHKVRDFSAGVGLPVESVYFTGGPVNPPLGYLDNETINIGIRWEGEVAVSGWPRLLIEVGRERRYAVFDGSSERDVRFRYFVRYDDHDPDGIGIPEGAIELHEGAIVSKDGRVPVDTDLGFNAIDGASGHEVRRTMPLADIRECSIERREVGRHPARFVLDEWDGTPFRVDIVKNFPSFVTDADLLELLEPIDSLADDIEDHLGYRILEAGGLVPVPAGMPRAWNADYHRYGEPPYVLPRESGQLLAFYMDDDSSFWDHRGGAPNVAFTHTGTTSYNRRTMGKWWKDEDPCCTGRFSANGRHGDVLVHEVSHLLGFEHPDVPFGTPGVRMAWGSLSAPWLSGSGVHFFAEKDLEVLKCLFPRRR